MASEELCWMPASEMAGLIRRKKLSPVEVIGAVLDRIAKVDGKLNAFVTLTAESARRAAKAAERALTRKGATLGPLHGVPFSVKDLVTTKGVLTTFGTAIEGQQRRHRQLLTMHQRSTPRASRCRFDRRAGRTLSTPEVPSGAARDARVPRPAASRSPRSTERSRQAPR